MLRDCLTSDRAPAGSSRLSAAAFAAVLWICPFAATDGVAAGFCELREASARLVLPALDAEDRSPLSDEERRVVRHLLKDLPTAGPYQYPRYAPMLIESLRAALTPRHT